MKVGPKFTFLSFQDPYVWCACRIGFPLTPSRDLNAQGIEALEEFPLKKGFHIAYFPG
jgi:hypothetical protein